jgi:ribonuclease HI
MAQAPAPRVEHTTPPAPWVIHCDGSAIPNPGRMGLGATLVAPDGQQHSLSLTSSLVGCNNEAELRALIAALQHAHALGAQAVAVCSDSTLLIEQLQPPQTDKRAPTPIARLAELFDNARAWLARFDSVQLQWIPRHRNSAADALARAALGAPAKVAQHPSHKKKKR